MADTTDTTTPAGVNIPNPEPSVLPDAFPDFPPPPVDDIPETLDGRAQVDAGDGADGRRGRGH